MYLYQHIKYKGNLLRAIENTFNLTKIHTNTSCINIIKTTYKHTNNSAADRLHICHFTEYQLMPQNQPQKHTQKYKDNIPF